MSLECAGSAREFAKLVDQVRSLARTLTPLALEPDGTAAAGKAARIGFYSHRHLSCISRARLLAVNLASG